MNQQDKRAKLEKHLRLLGKKGVMVCTDKPTVLMLDHIVRTKGGADVVKPSKTKVPKGAIILNNCKPGTLGNGTWGAIDAMVKYHDCILIGQTVYHMKCQLSEA